MNRRVSYQLSEEEKQLVRAFITSILLPVQHQRRGRNNELSTIAAALDKWFKRFLDFHVDVSELADLLEELEPQGYAMRSFGEVYDPETKRSRAVPELGEYRGEKPYTQRRAMYIYVNIDPKRVAGIRSLCTTLPPNTGLDKLSGLLPLEDELRSFLVKHIGR